jgi:hypothetical protein
VCKIAVLAVMICALLVGLVPAANADAWIKWKDQSINQSLEIVPVELVDPATLEAYVWQFGSSFDAPGLLVDDSSNDYHVADFPQHLRVVGGGSGDWACGDPSVPIYVRLVAKVQNTGTEDWYDFHLRAVSGCEIYNKYVSDYGTWFPAYWNYDGETLGSLGWDYVVDPTSDPAWGYDFGPVHPGEYFGFETWIQVTDPAGNFEVEFWPTVPEPGSLLGLGVGLAGLMGHILRRRTSR